MFGVGSQWDGVHLVRGFGNIPPAEAEESYYAMMAETAVAA